MMLSIQIDSISRKIGAFWPIVTLFSLIDLLWLWHDRVQQRDRLVQMSDRELDDIGITYGQALAEYRKPFWRA